MDTALAFQYGLLYGLILSALMTVFILASLRISAEMWLDDYPPDVRAKWGSMSTRAQKLKRRLGLPRLALILTVLVLQVTQLLERSGGFSFGEVALSLWLSMMVFNLIDLLLIDWFLIMTLRPRWAILPGTEGLQGYLDYGFHFRGFLKGTVGITLAAPILAVVAFGVYALAG